MTHSVFPDPSDFSVSRDPGPSRFRGRVYAKLSGGLLLSAGTAWFVANTSGVTRLFFTHLAEGEIGFTGLGIGLVCSPLLVLFLASFIIRGRPTVMGAIVYWVITVSLGGSLSLLFLAYSSTVLTSSFAMTAALFSSLGVIGLATKRNLGGFGNFTFIALLGFVLAMALNQFFENSVADLTLNIAGIIIFAGLIGADTQSLRNIYYGSKPGKLVLASDTAALILYLNFLNLFQLLTMLSAREAQR